MKEEQMCCPEFDPKPWDEVVYEWYNKPFLVDSIPQVFHIPLPGTFAKTMNKMWETAKKYEIAPEIKDFLLLAYDPSPWKSELYLAITGEHRDLKNVVKLSGKYVSKVFDGPFKDIPNYIKIMDEYLKNNNQTAKKYYFHYTTCPKCAKKYGHNYIVAFAEV